MKNAMTATRPMVTVATRIALLNAGGAEGDPTNPTGPQICLVASGTDYVTAGYESCDDGNLLSNDGCSADQQQEPGYDCTYTDYLGPGCSIPGKKSTCEPLGSTEDTIYGLRLKKRLALAVVCSAIFSTVVSLSSATFRATSKTNEGSFRLPR